MGTLALGRVLSTRSVRGSNFSEPFCSYKQTASPRLGVGGGCPAAKCSKCNSAVAGQAHPPSAMSDSSFRHPDIRWQSADGVKEEELRLDLEAEFFFTHLIVVVRSPRPAAMDRGRTWETLRHFARDCLATFGLAEGSACTSKYSGAFPCSRGEVSSAPGCSDGKSFNLLVLPVLLGPAAMRIQTQRGAGGRGPVEGQAQAGKLHFWCKKSH